jgi:hypothetical protein
MKKLLLSATLLSLGFTALPATADIGIGADLVNRYVWRGTDFGDAVSVQPSIAYSTDSFEIGAWSSWGITSNGMNENDLYVSFAAGPVGITVSDYYFPGYTGSDGLFDYGSDGAHVIEVMGSFEAGSMSIAAAVNVLGDDDNSLWVELGYGLGEIDEADVSLSAGLGNGAYTTDGDPMVASIGISVSKGDYSASYIINPDQETSFLVFGRSF